MADQQLETPITVINNDEDTREYDYFASYVHTLFVFQKTFDDYSLAIISHRYAHLKELLTIVDQICNNFLVKHIRMCFEDQDIDFILKPVDPISNEFESYVLPLVWIAKKLLENGSKQDLKSAYNYTRNYYTKCKRIYSTLYRPPPLNSVKKETPQSQVLTTKVLEKRTKRKLYDSDSTSTQPSPLNTKRKIFL